MRMFPVSWDVKTVVVHLLLQRAIVNADAGFFVLLRHNYHPKGRTKGGRVNYSSIQNLIQFLSCDLIMLSKVLFQQQSPSCLFPSTVRSLVRRLTRTASIMQLWPVIRFFGAGSFGEVGHHPRRKCARCDSGLRCSDGRFAKED